MAEEVPSLPHPPPLIPPMKQRRINPQDLRNSDLVSRFLAATPPYLYSPPVGTQNFFFSEMLKSLVQAKSAEQNNKHLSQPSRRQRKRSWNQSRCMLDSQQSEITKETKEGESLSHIIDRVAVEKPLELTNKTATFSMSPNSIKLYKYDNQKVSSSDNVVKSQRHEVTDISIPNSNKTQSIDPASHMQTITSEPSTASLPPSDLVLPPPPPMWYPPLYPPYGIDPLHFFIDLRVSSHIYDRKKENISPSSTNNDNNNTISPAIDSTQIGKFRHGSAFTVPPRREKSPLALNLTSTTAIQANKSTKTDYNSLNYYNHNDNDKDINVGSKNTNYVLQNLPRIYTTLTPQNSDDRQSLLSEETDKSDSDLQEVGIKDEDGDFDLTDDVVIVDQDQEHADNNNINKS